jgi:hypothetical protein
MRRVLGLATASHEPTCIARHEILRLGTAGGETDTLSVPDVSDERHAVCFAQAPPNARSSVARLLTHVTCTRHVHGLPTARIGSVSSVSRPFLFACISSCLRALLLRTRSTPWTPSRQLPTVLGWAHSRRP